MRSILYWNSYIYSFLVRLQFNKYYTDRYIAVKNIIEDNSSVIDVCCGDSKLYSFLKCKNVKYLGLDFNTKFIKYSKKNNINVKNFNIIEEVIPKADYVVMQASLYQFIPDHNQVINKLFNAALKCLIITEPVKSFAQSKNRVISMAGKLLNNPGDSLKEHRFTLKTLKEAMSPFSDNIVKEFLIKGGIEYLVDIRKN